MLTDQALTEILGDYSFWESAPPKTIERDIKLPKALHNDIALLIQGVRRCGKLTLLTQLPLHYKLLLKNCFFCNFEDVRLISELNDPNLLTHIVKLARQSIPNEQPCYFFFDEIQTVRAWEKWLHMQFERPKQNFFVLTGSNSYLLNGEYATSLTGRSHTIKLYLFSFTEYKKIFHKNTLEQYIIAGGFPRALISEEPQVLLRDYFNDIIYRDILKRTQSNNVDAIKQVAKIAFESCGSELSLRNVTWNAPLPRHEKALDAFYAVHPHANDPVYITQENAQEFL